MGKVFPTLNQWYQDVDSQQIFEIVAFDGRETTIEVQYIDGELDEFELGSWRSLSLKLVAPPEDWTVSFEIPKEDMGFIENTEWLNQNPLQSIEPEFALGVDDEY